MKINKIGKYLEKLIRIVSAAVLFAYIACFSHAAYIIYTFDKTYPLPYMPAWVLPAGLAIIIFKTMFFSYLIFGDWSSKENEKNECRKGNKEYKEKAGDIRETNEEEERKQQ